MGVQRAPLKWWESVLVAVFWLFWLAVGILALTLIGAVLFAVLDWLLS